MERFEKIQSPAFRFDPEKDFWILDQSLLPFKKQFVEIKSPEDMASAIKNLKVRGANLIGISAGFSLSQYAFKNPRAGISLQAEMLKSTRPTAIHLAKAVDLVMRQKGVLKKLRAAIAFYEEDKKACEKMADRAQAFIEKGDGILTYCNTGCLATGSTGTALAALKKAFKDGKCPQIFVCETRPVGQGARLTFYELVEEGFPATLICDNMSASLMAQGKIQKVFTGADRISSNGDVANKIGTLQLALSAKHFNIPFYVLAPSCVIDQNLPSGRDIPIEEREPSEVSPYWAKRGMDQRMKQRIASLSPPETQPNTAQIGRQKEARQESGRQELGQKIGQRIKQRIKQGIKQEIKQEVKQGKRRASTGSKSSNPPAFRIYNPGFDITPFELISGILTETGLYKAETTKAP